MRYYSDVCKKRNKYCKKIKVDSLITLCEIKNYDEFSKDLEKLISSKRGIRKIFNLYDVMQGKFIFGSKKYKDFIKKYQNVIDIMKKNNCLESMILYKYDKDGKSYYNHQEEYFYNFISEHKEDIETIKNVAFKIKSLGFDKIIYGEKLDFTDSEYELDKIYSFDFEYLENMELVPTYTNNPIKYKTNDSCYCMSIKLNGFGTNKGISEFGREIELNSLIFDSNRLPNEITYDSTLSVINNLFIDGKKDLKKIRDILDMSVCTDDLISQYNITKKMIESIEDVKDKEELKQVLTNISKDLDALKKAGLSFEKEIINSSDTINEEIIKNEKDQYIKRRINSQTDLC